MVFAVICRSIRWVSHMDPCFADKVTVRLVFGMAVVSSWWVRKRKITVHERSVRPKMLSKQGTRNRKIWWTPNFHSWKNNKLYNMFTNLRAHPEFCENFWKLAKKHGTVAPWLPGHIAQSYTNSSASSPDGWLWLCWLVSICRSE